jgi:hypothetical protein
MSCCAFIIRSSLEAQRLGLTVKEATLLAKEEA